MVIFLLMKWFKFYGQDWLTDLKIMRMSIEDRLCFITLLCLASSAEAGGTVKNCDEEALIQLTHLYEDPYDSDNQVSRARGCLKRYEALHCVTINDNGDVTVLNFDRRQGENLSNAERQKNYRERHKPLQNKVKTPPVERNDSNVTPRNDSNARVEENRIDKNTITRSDERDPEETSYEPDEDTKTTKQNIKARNTVDDGYAKAEVTELISWAEERMGHPIIPVRNKKAIKTMFLMGFGKERIKEAWIGMEEDEFWSEKGFDFTNVWSQITKYKGRPKKKINVLRASDLKRNETKE